MRMSSLTVEQVMDLAPVIPVLVICIFNPYYFFGCWRRGADRGGEGGYNDKGSGPRHGSSSGRNN